MSGWLSSAALPRTVASASALVAGSGYRALQEQEIELLARQGNSADDWSKVRVREGWCLESAKRVRNCSFSGKVLIGTQLGKCALSDGVHRPCGAYDTLFVDSVLDDDVLVLRTDLISRAVLLTGAVVAGCGVVSCTSAATAAATTGSSATGGAAPDPAPSTFANGAVVSVGAEVGGRRLRVACELPLQQAIAVARHQSPADPSHVALRAAHDADVSEYVRRVSFGHTVVGRGARVRWCPRVTDALIGDGAVVEASTLERVSIASSLEEPVLVAGGSMLLRSLLQFGCRCESMAVVEDSLMCEYSYVDRHGKLLSSILGPNSGVSEGECASSLAGPFVGFHHQSLLIASFWPEGKGNVGYGANVGSNHTGRAPDQELWPGEGVFFGLGTSIKFPANYVAAQYSVIATGVVALPQTVAMPFSLINTPTVPVPGLSPAFNEITPGWVLLDSAYTLLRNEAKYQSRDKARRTTVGHEVFSERVARDMHAARKQLLDAAGSAKVKDAQGGDVFLDRQVPGVGKNYMTEASRKRGIQAYTTFLRLYALRGVWRVLAAQGRSAASTVGLCVRSLSHDARWEHERAILGEELPEEADAGRLLELLAEAERGFVESALRGKSKDDARGPRTIPDYADTHTPAAADPMILDARARLRSRL